jgi:hypothetical protein
VARSLYRQRLGPACLVVNIWVLGGALQASRVETTILHVRFVALGTSPVRRWGSIERGSCSKRASDARDLAAISIDNDAVNAMLRAIDATD